MSEPTIDCEDCIEDAGFRCLLCGVDSCGEHAIKHECDPGQRLAYGEADGIARRWVPDYMTARHGMVDDIAAALLRYRQLGREENK